MTLLLFDGFDDSLQSAEVNSLDIWQPASSVGFNNETRNGVANSPSRAMRIASTYSAGHNFASDQSGNTLFIGFAFKTQEPNRTTYDVLSLCEGTTRDSAVQWMLTVEDGYFKIYRGDTTTLLATGTHYLQPETYYYIQIKSLVHNSTGIFELKIGSTVTEFSLTSQDTQQQSTDSVQRLQLGYQSGWFDYAFVDDFYICNDVGSAPYNTYLGIMRSIRVYPSGDITVNCTCSSGANNYALIDEQSTPSASDYVYTSTSTDRDTYDVTNMPTDVSSVLAVRIESKLNKNGIEYYEYKHGVKSGATNQFGTTYIVPDAFKYTYDEFLTSDGVSTAWTETTINSMQMMIEKV